MSEFEDQMDELLARYTDPNKRYLAVYKNHKELTLFFIRQGFKEYEVQKQREIRNNIKKTILRPEVLQEGAPVKPAIRVKPTARTMTHMTDRAIQQLGIFTDWKLGKLPLGDATKGKLITEANHERARGQGHIINAIFYEKLARPMNDSETVANHWKSPETVKLIRDEIISNITTHVGFSEKGHQPQATV